MSAEYNSIDYQDFQFEEDGHIYRDSTGETHLSITQMMQKVGIYDFSMVNPAVLENARRRGTNVHKWCAEIDLYGFIDETWVAEDEWPYVEAWIKFKRDTGLVVRVVEKPMLRLVNGFMVGGTPDVIGFIKGQQFVVERKACRAKHPGWGIQTALQEMLVTGKPRVGHMGRMAVQLKPDAKYTPHIHDDAEDGIAALNIVQKFAAEKAIRNWMQNHNLAVAA